MEEKGKVVTIEINDEEEDLQALVDEIEADEEMEEDIQPVHAVAKFLEYIPSRKEKAKVPKDLDSAKSALQTPLLPDGIVFEGTHLGCMQPVKFEYWDLADHEKFPHLETGNLMKQNTAGIATMFELRKWLRRVEKIGLLNLLWVSHFHHAPITNFIIRLVLYLVRSGRLWLEEPIPIMEHFIHRIT